MQRTGNGTISTNLAQNEVFAPKWGVFPHINLGLPHRETKMVLTHLASQSRVGHALGPGGTSGHHFDQSLSLVKNKYNFVCFKQKKTKLRGVVELLGGGCGSECRHVTQS
jgi:hypothetical protein